MPSTTSVTSQRSRVRRAEAIIANDLIRADRAPSPLDDALRAMVDYMRQNPDATPDEVAAAMGPLLAGAIDRYLARLYGVLVEDVPAAIDGLTQ